MVLKEKIEIMMWFKSGSYDWFDICIENAEDFSLDELYHKFINILIQSSHRWLKLKQSYLSSGDFFVINIDEIERFTLQRTLKEQSINSINTQAQPSQK